MTISRDDITRVAGAYTLDDDQHHRLRDALEAAILTAMLATYRAAQRVVGAKGPAWQPSAGQKAPLATQAAQAASSIAETFSSEVGAYVDSYLLEIEAAGVPGGWGAAISGLVTGVKEWLRDHLTWKAPQIANATTGAGEEAGTVTFAGDFVDGTVEAGDDIDPQNVEVAVIPQESSSDLCATYAGNTYPIQDYQLIPPFPAHPNCIHRKVVQYIAA